MHFGITSLIAVFGSDRVARGDGEIECLLPRKAAYLSVFLETLLKS
jgi:hypothetical protein